MSHGPQFTRPQLMRAYLVRARLWPGLVALPPRYALEKGVPRYGLAETALALVSPLSASPLAPRPRRRVGL